MDDKKCAKSKDWGLLLAMIGACLVAFGVICFIGFPSSVSGTSMMPTYKSGQNVFISRLSNEYERYDVVAAGLNRPVIKRIIGLPGETVQIIDGYIYIDNEKLNEPFTFPQIQDAGVAEYPVILQENEYFILGDNRNNSNDSRSYGAITKDDIIGKAIPNKKTR